LHIFVGMVEEKRRGLTIDIVMRRLTGGFREFRVQLSR